MATSSPDPLVASFARAWRVKHGENHTLRNYRGAIARLSQFLTPLGRDLSTATLDDLEEFLAVRQNHVAAATAHVDFRVIRAFYKWAALRATSSPPTRPATWSARRYPSRSWTTSPTTTTARCWRCAGATRRAGASETPPCCRSLATDPMGRVGSALDNAAAESFN